MDGKLMLYQVRQLLQEGSYSTFMDDRTTFDYLYEAACEFVSSVKNLVGVQEITTAPNTALYDVNPDFLCLDIMNDFNEHVIKYSDGAGTYWIPYRDFNYAYMGESPSGSSIPNTFSITGMQSTLDSVGGTASGAVASCRSADGHGAVLTSSGDPFADTFPGDLIHNITDESDGVVVKVNSATEIVTALFGGTLNEWTAGDEYVIIPQNRKQLFLDPKSLTIGHVITLRYISRPSPVYTNYGSYRIPEQYMPAIVKYAAWLYKYRDREPNFGDAWYKQWDMQLRRARVNERRMPDDSKFRVNMRKLTTSTQRSMR